jgi:protein ImuB
MSGRWLSLWLPAWPIERVAAAARRQGEPLPPDRPLALVAGERGALRLTAVDALASAQGLRPGLPLADARAICPALLVRDAAPERDAAALKALALRCRRWSPRTAPDGADGILVDLAGCAHLRGGEAGVLADAAEQLGRTGLTVRAAIAGRPLAAWAWARFGEGGILAEAGARERLARLPVEALGIGADTAAALRRLGLRRIGQLLPLPPSALRNRFGADLPDRLERMLGDAEAAWTPLREPHRFAARLAFADPIGRTEDVEEAVCRLTALVCRDLERAQAGARRWRLALRRVDGDTALLEARTGRPGRDAGHVLRLLALDLDGLDAGFGIELVRLEAVEVVPLGAEQARLADRDDADGLARLVDRLAARLGPARVQHLQPVDSHWPERAVLPVPAGTPLVPRPWLARQPRPLRLLSHPQPVEALARVPDGPPVRLGIGRFRQRVLLATGPERILPEWWRGEGTRPRDYYRVTVEDGRVFWVYREGAYGEPEPPTWWLHGLFL